MVLYKLNYFNMRGRAEVTRLLFVVAGQEFQDNRIEQANWPTLKPNTPLGTLPVLEFNDGSKTIKISQSVTIARYVAKKLNMAGKDDLEQAMTDMYADQVTDLLNDFAKVHNEKDEEKKNADAQKFMAENFPKHLTIFENRLGQNNGFLGASSLTYADLYLFAVLDMLGDKLGPALSAYPNISKLVTSIRENPKVKTYLEKRPKTEC